MAFCAQHTFARKRTAIDSDFSDASALACWPSRYQNRRFAYTSCLRSWRDEISKLVALISPVGRCRVCNDPSSNGSYSVAQSTRGL